MVVTSDHVLVGLVGLLIFPIGVWWVRHPLRVPGDDKATRMQNQVHRVGALLFGGAMAIGGPLLVFGAVVGAIFWADHGEPRWPW